MKITPKVLYQRVKGALSEALHLDLSGLGIGAIEALESCPKLESLDLSRNCLEEIDSFECCKNLWRINVSDNKITCLGTLSKMFAIGTLDLSNNDLSWNELLRIRHVYILDLHLYGNNTLENDTYYRLHVIDCLPNIWMLDGRLVTGAERLQVQQFFHDSALSSRPVRHKLNEHSYAYFRPSKSEEIHGTRTCKFTANFPLNEPQNSETDRRRLEYLAYNIQEDLKNRKKSMKRPSSWISNNCLKIVIANRYEDNEKCNMLLLLLVASLEFELPDKLLTETLRISKLNPLYGVETEPLFHLDPSARTEVISLLVSSCKLDRELDKHTCGGLYDRLYLCLYHSVIHLLRKTSNAKRKGWFDKLSKDGRLNSAISHYRHVIDTKAATQMKQVDDWKSHRILLASELVLLLSVVPSFYHTIVSKDMGVYHIVSLATSGDQFYQKLTRWSEKLMTEGGDTNSLCREICKSVIRRIEMATIEHVSTVKNSRSCENRRRSQTVQTSLILSTPEAYPKRPKSAVLVSGERLTKSKRYDKSAEFINMVRPYDMQHLTLGSFVLLGPQNLARVVALPESHIALVQMQLIPSANGSVRVHAKDEDEHYCYVDIRKLTYDHVGHYWKPRGAVGDKVTLQVDEDFVVPSFAEEKASKREKLASKNFPTRPVYSAGSKKQPMQRSPSSYSNRMSPVNSLTFISRDASKFENEELDPNQFRPETRPLSTAYCERMEITLSEMTQKNDCSHQHNDPHQGSTSNRPRRASGFSTTRNQNEVSSEDSDQEINLTAAALEGHWNENGQHPTDPYINPQYSHDGYATDLSSNISERHADDMLSEDPLKINIDASEEVREELDRSESSTPQVSFRLLDSENHVPDVEDHASDVDDEAQDVSYRNEAELEEQLRSRNAEEDDVEAELEKLIIDEDAESAPYQHGMDTEQASDIHPSPRGIQVENMKLITKSAGRNWFAVSGATVPLAERPAGEKKLRVKSALDRPPKPKYDVHGPPSRPVSAIVTPKKLLFYQKDLMKEDSRPGSASSFQIMRTEAWRSSASSASTGFPTSAVEARKFTQFVVNEQITQNSKGKFSMRMRRPPPQRPTSPDHETPSDVGNPRNLSFSAPTHSLVSQPSLVENSHSEPLSTSHWLAQGRNLHEEVSLHRQSLSAHRLPGYMEGIHLPPKLMKKRRYITRAKVGIDSLPSRPIKPSAMHPYTIHRHGSEGDPLFQSSSSSQTRPVSYSRPRFSTLNELKRLSSPLPSTFTFKQQYKR